MAVIEVVVVVVVEEGESDASVTADTRHIKDMRKALQLTLNWMHFANKQDRIWWQMCDAPNARMVAQGFNGETFNVQVQLNQKWRIAFVSELCKVFFTFAADKQEKCNYLITRIS